MTFSPGTLVMLILAACGSGLANALAGGGTFIIFPALLLAGVAPVNDQLNWTSEKRSLMTATMPTQDVSFSEM